jgi:hypothetical protein
VRDDGESVAGIAAVVLAAIFVVLGAVTGRPLTGVVGGVAWLGLVALRRRGSL